MNFKFKVSVLACAFLGLNAFKALHADDKNHTVTNPIEVHQDAPPATEKKVEHKREKGPISAADSFKELVSGNKRFIDGKGKKTGLTEKDRLKLVSGQKPHAIVLSCSDSRVPPEHVFDQKLGEIFVVRTAGEALDSSAIASIEYAISHLGSNLIVVMGHESCGAVKAALGTLDGGDAGSVWLNKLVKDIHPRLKKFSGLPQSEGVLVESWANVNGVVFDLLDRSEIVSQAVKSGDVEIRKALYHLGDGKVEWRD